MFIEELRLVGSCGFEGDDGRARFSPDVFAWTGEPVNVGDPLVVRAEDRQPSVQVLAKDLVLRAGVRLDRPDRIFGNCHGTSLKQIQ